MVSTAEVLSPAEVHLWLCSPDDVAESSLAACERLLDGEDARAAARLSRPQDRRLRLISRALLRSVLARYVGRAAPDLRFRRDEHGRPQVVGGCDVAFSLSHTAGLIACAVTRGGSAVGVDVERLQPRDLTATVARRFFSEAERARLEGVATEMRAAEFFSYWVLKEAYVKAIGRGISLGLRTFTVELDGDRAGLVRGEPTLAAERQAGIVDEEWTLALLEPRAGYRLGLATTGGPARIVARWTVPVSDDLPASPRLLASSPGVRTVPGEPGGGVSSGA